MLEVGTLVKPSTFWLNRHPGFGNPDVIGVVTSFSLLDCDRVIVCWMDSFESCEEPIEDIEVVSD